MGFVTDEDVLTPNRVLKTDNMGNVEASNVTGTQLDILEDSQVLNFVKYDSDAGADNDVIYNYSMTDDGGFVVQVGYQRNTGTSAIYVKTSSRCFITSMGIYSGSAVSRNTGTATYITGETFCRTTRNNGANIANYDFQITPTLSTGECAVTQLTVNSDQGTASWVYTFDVRATVVDTDEVILSVKCIGGRRYSNK